MNAEFKKLWLDALRSGKFKQERGKLKSENDEYCCLGVLLEVAGVSSYKEGDRYLYVFENTASKTTLPVKFQRKADISNEDESKLIAMNDAQKVSFTQIADWIEQNL